MKILNLLLFLTGIGCLIAAIAGHSAAWSATASLFTACGILSLAQRRKNEKKQNK